jgi:hypothetical protein
MAASVDISMKVASIVHQKPINPVLLANDPKLFDRTGTQILDLADDSGPITAFVVHAPFVAQKAVSV